MKTNRIGNTFGALVALLCAGGLAACTTTESSGGGTGGSGAGGTTPLGSGGSVGGSTGTAGADGTLCPPPQQIITQFTYTPSDAGVSTKEVRFGIAGTLQGGESFYPTDGTITSDVTQGNWHLSGTVSNYSGFALYFDACDRLDASQFKGIRFTISGSVPQGNAITMGVGTVADKPTGVWMKDVGGATAALPTDSGRCLPTSGNQYYHPGCTDPQTAIAVPASPTVTEVLWTKLTGGTPVSSPNPKEITTIYWFFPWSDAATPYQVDLVMDNLEFIP